jgi:hypothetical protein
MLEMIRKTLGVGNIYFSEEKLSKFPQSDFRVGHREDLSHVIIPFFDRYPLRSKKARDFQVWREIVLGYKCASRQHTKVGVGSLSSDKWEEACYLVSQLRDGRAFEIDPDTAERARQRVLTTHAPLVFPEPEQLVMDV